MMDTLDIKGTYARGKVTFMGVDIMVAPGALIPRRETELLGSTALSVLADITAPRVIDMCCGAGNLACGLASHLPHARIHASDLTDGCVEVARRNVGRLQLMQRVHVHQGDLFGAVRGLGLEGLVDAVVCNPPYISDQRLSGDRAGLLAHEPRAAFDGGPWGLAIHQRVIREAPDFLKPRGWLLFEIGEGQQRQVSLLFDRSRAYETARPVCDAAGEVRVMIARRL